MKTLLAVILQQIKKKTTKMKMKKVIIFAGLLLAMSHTAFAEQCGVFMEFHRKVNPEHTRDVNRAPLRLPIDVVYDSDTHKIEVVGNEEMEVQIFLCDENGNYIDFDEAELVQALEQIDDMNVRYFTPSESEMKLYQQVYDNLTAEMVKKYQEQTEPIKAYNRRKIENWEHIQMEQLVATCQEMAAEISVLKAQEQASDNFYEKIDIRKKITEKSNALEKFQESFHERGTGIKIEGEREISEFEKQFDIKPILFVNIVLKF